MYQFNFSASNSKPGQEVPNYLDAICCIFFCILAMVFWVVFGSPKAGGHLSKHSPRMKTREDGTASIPVPSCHPPRSRIKNLHRSCGIIDGVFAKFLIRGGGLVARPHRPSSSSTSPAAFSCPAAPPVQQRTAAAEAQQLHKIQHIYTQRSASNWTT